MKYIFLCAFLLTQHLSSGQGWSKALKDNYLSSCVTAAISTGKVNKSQATVFCNCTLVRLSSAYPNPTETPIDPSVVKRVQQECGAALNEQFGGSNKLEWGPAIEANFMKKCRESIMTPNRNPATVNAICSCILEKTKKKYRYPVDIDKQVGESILLYESCK